ncbi:hypothetical protein IK110_04015 [Candidatus Saccharibacteria bacterium]|nr:hypothetical protein [Candidatus Saccharibacteria bacterium]
MIIIATIGAFLATAVLGYILSCVVHYLVVQPWLYGYLFKRSLRLIRANGRGANENINQAAIEWNLGGRLRVVLAVPAVLLIIIVVSVVLLLRNGILPMPVAVAIAIGYLLAYFWFIWIFLQKEQDGKMYCGRVIDIAWDTKTFIMDTGSTKIEFDCPESTINDSFLVCGKKYLIGYYLYGWQMAPCDYYEWNDRKFPG